MLLTPTRLVPTLLAGLALATMPSSAQAQNAPAEKVKFETVDEVEIRGTFWPGSKGKKGATILFLHQVGTGFNSKNEGWDALALKLQNNGHSVLSFDFRGHGESTSVSSGFWKLPTNQILVKGYRVANPSTTISYANFNPTYIPMLVNDICAAKMFLDRRNDAGECNSANVVLIGAQQGGALGALWLNGEWNRFRTVQTDPFNGLPIRWENTAEGKKVYAAIWLSISNNIGSFPGSVPVWLTTPGKDQHTPMAFFYGDQDLLSKNLASSLITRLTDGGKMNKDYIRAVPIKGTNRVGAAILKPDLGQDAVIADAVEGLLKIRVNLDWAEIGNDRVGYVWNFPNYPAIAKTDGERYFRVFRLDRYNFRIQGFPTN